MKKKSENFEIFSKIIRDYMPDNEIKIYVANVYLYTDNVYFLKVVVGNKNGLTRAQLKVIEEFKLTGWQIYDEQFSRHKHVWFFYPETDEAFNLFTQSMIRARKASVKTIEEKISELRHYVNGRYVTIF